jgi:hypothetical protein
MDAGFGEPARADEGDLDCETLKRAQRHGADDRSACTAKLDQDVLHTGDVRGCGGLAIADLPRSLTGGRLVERDEDSHRWHAEPLEQPPALRGAVRQRRPQDVLGLDALRAPLQSPRRPTAIVYTSDLVALGGLGVARQLGMTVPDDVSIAGFDDAPLASLSSPPFTTVRIDGGGFGETAASMLLAEIEGLPPPTLELAPPKLIRRSSTGPAPEGSARE